MGLLVVEGEHCPVGSSRGGPALTGFVVTSHRGRHR
jgi:hypothetical protein